MRSIGWVRLKDCRVHLVKCLYFEQTTALYMFLLGKNCPSSTDPIALNVGDTILGILNL